MEKDKILELQRIIERNPQILDSLYPLEREVIARLCKGLDKGKAKAKPFPA